MNRRDRCCVLVRLLPLIVTVTASLLAPQGAPVSVKAQDLGPIQIYDVAPDTGAVTLNNLTLDGLTQYFGLGQQPMTICVFRAARIAFNTLWEAPPNRTDIFVHTKNPTRGAADAIEFITRASSRRQLLVEPVPGTTGVSMTVENWEFTFMRKSSGKAAVIQVIAIPDGMLQLRAIVVGKQMRGEKPTSEELAQYQGKVKEFTLRLNTWPDEQVFNVTVKDYQIPAINPDRFISYYAPEIESEWFRLKGLETENQGLRTQLAASQSQVESVTAERETLKGELSQATMLQYALVGTTVVFLVTTLLLALRRRQQPAD